MVVKYAVLLFVLYVCALLQASFLPYFSIMSAVPNLILVVFFISIFFEPKGRYYEGCIMAGMAGFFLDAAGNSYFGISMAVLLLLYCLKNMAEHFLKGGRNQYSFTWFAIIFCLGYVAYQGFLLLAGLLLAEPVRFSPALVIGLGYSFAVAAAVFYVYKVAVHKETDDNQLKLL